MLEENKHHFLKVIGVIIATFLGAFLAFYLAVDLTLNRMFNPEYQIRKMERTMNNIQKFDEKMMESPFVPKMSPMLVNLVKEPNEYKVIVDLKSLGDDEKNVDVKLDNNMVTISGDMQKNEVRGEKIMNFSQSFYLDEKLIPNKIIKERKGNKYIVTIPFED
mgnify:CR=1 FL=1